jgi:hypothetical protein
MPVRDAQERPLLATLAWLGGVAAVALSLWLVWRAQRRLPPPAPVLQPAPAAAPVAPSAGASVAAPAPGAAADEVTHEERRALEDVLKRKGTQSNR